MRVGLAVVGLLLALGGGVFAGQGLGYIPGSFMTGDMKWFWIGTGMMAAGGIILVGTLFRRSSR